jgi:hypothetical protein
MIAAILQRSLTVSLEPFEAAGVSPVASHSDLRTVQISVFPCFHSSANPILERRQALSRRVNEQGFLFAHRFTSCALSALESTALALSPLESTLTRFTRAPGLCLHTLRRFRCESFFPRRPATAAAWEPNRGFSGVSCSGLRARCRRSGRPRTVFPERARAASRGHAPERGPSSWPECRRLGP